MSMDPRAEALRNSRGEDYAVVMALVHVGDQVAELGRLLEAVKENLSMPPYPHFLAIQTPTGLGDSTWVPGDLRGVVAKQPWRCPSTLADGRQDRCGLYSYPARCTPGHCSAGDVGA